MENLEGLYEPKKTPLEVLIAEKEAYFAEKKVGERNMIFELVNHKSHQYIKPKERISDGNVVYHIRYYQGCSTPFVTQQEGLVPEDIILKGIQFSKHNPKQETALLMAPKSDPCLQKFLLLSQKNKVNGGNFFRLQDKVAEAQQEVDHYTLVAKTILAIEEAKNIQLSGAYSAYFGYSTTSTAEVPTVKAFLTKQAQMTPQTVLDLLEDERQMTRFRVFLAFKNKHFKYKQSDRGIYKTRGKKPIMSLPIGIELEEYVADHVLAENDKIMLKEIIKSVGI